MKKKLSIIILLGIIIGMLPKNVSATSEVQGYFNIPSAGEHKESVREFEFTYPAEAERILGDGYSVSKGEITYFAPNSTTRKLILRVKGQEVNKNPVTVKGFSGSKDRKFTSNPGNAMCRFSDGKDWQITSYNTDGTLRQYKLPGDGTVPTKPYYTAMPELIAFVTPVLNPSAATWYVGDKQISSSLIDMSTVRVPEETVESKVGSKLFKTGTTYNPQNPSFGTRYKPTTKEYAELVPIPATNEAFLTGHAICYRYPAPMEYALEAETLGEKVYLYEGIISYKYIKPSEPYMTGTLKTDPNSVKFTDTDIKVKVTLDAEVHNITNANVIDRYMIYLRTEDGSVSADPIIVQANGKKTVTGTHEFTIPKSVMSSKSEHTEVYVGRARACYKPSELYKGCIETDLLKANTMVYKQDPPVIDPPNVEPSKIKPVAVISGMAEVKLGDYTYFDGYNSYDEDGYIEEYRWSTPNAKGNAYSEWSPFGAEVEVYYEKMGPQKVLLYVKDNDGLQNGAYYSLNVVEPTIDANLRQSGTLKENRKVTFTESSDTPFKYPAVDEKTTWKIESEYGDLDSYIRHDSNLNGKKSIDVLFKKAGTYKVTVIVENTAGYTSSKTRVYEIKPDESPYVNFDFQKKIYRDPSNENKATFTLYDRSYSFDGDDIVKRNWYVIFDANNDGIFNENKVLFNTENNTVVTYDAKHVGNYRFLLEVQEEFGQPTIDKFVTASDRKGSNTWQ